MNKNVLLLVLGLGLGFQPLCSMDFNHLDIFANDAPESSLSKIPKRVMSKYADFQDCELDLGVVSPVMTAFDLLARSRNGYSVSPIKSPAEIKLTSSDVSLVGLSRVESSSPSSKSPVSLVEFGAGSEPALKPFSMIVGMKPYDSKTPSVISGPIVQIPIVGAQKQAVAQVVQVPVKMSTRWCCGCFGN